MQETQQPLPLTLEPSYPEKSESDGGDWQKVRLMPALLRIFTRVNLLVMVGEDQGMVGRHALLAESGLTSGSHRSRSPRSLRRYHELLLELCQRFPGPHSRSSLSLPVSGPFESVNENIYKANRRADSSVPCR